MCFHVMKNVDDAILGSHGIREPDSSRHPEISPLEIDFFLVPGVGFDPSCGTRLGRGKGHYDRYLAEVRLRKDPAHFVGVAFSLQLLPLAAEGHDIPMDRILTEIGWS